MAYASAYLCQKTPRVPHFSLTSLTCVGSSTRRRNLHVPRGKDVIPEPTFGTRNKRQCISHQRKPEKGPTPTLAANSNNIYETHSLSDVVKKFYICINEDDRTGLEDLISSNCHLEDSAFPYIIQGKKEVMSLLIQLAESMGENVQFKLGTVCEGECCSH